MIHKQQRVAKVGETFRKRGVQANIYLIDKLNFHDGEWQVAEQKQHTHCDEHFDEIHFGFVFSDVFLIRGVVQRQVGYI